LNALLADTTAGGNAVINNVKALVPLATTTVAGLIEEATGEETLLGATDPNKDDRAVTPGSMSYALQGGRDYPIHTTGGVLTNGFLRSFVPEGSQAEVAWKRGISATWTAYIPSTAGVSDLRFFNGIDRIIFADSGAISTISSVTATSYITSSDATLKENITDIDAAKALQFRNGLQWKRYEVFSESQTQIMEDVTDSEGNTTQVPTGRYEAKRSSQGIKRGLIAQEVLALAQSIGDFTDVVVEVGEYFTLDAQGYPVKDAQGNNIVNKRLGIDYDAVSFCVMCAEQSLTLGA
jgi:hypothetical protein